MLNTLQIFNGVKTTRDYSVVMGLSKSAWYTALTNEHTVVYSENVNYYRLFDRIRIEAKYETIRTCPYGCLILRDEDGSDYDKFYFWIDEVKLLKQGCLTERDSGDVIISQNDVLELTIAEDVWANNYSEIMLRDSYVERRHMPRWENIGTDLSPVWKPVYYANAGQGVEGAYTLETREDAYKNILEEDFDWDPLGDGPEKATAKMFFVQISVLKSDGQTKIYGIPIGVTTSENYSWYINITENPSGNGYKFYLLNDIIDGTFYDDAGITADNVQSIVIYPMMSNLLDSVTFNHSVTPPTAVINLQPLNMMSSAFFNGHTKLYYDINTMQSYYRAAHRAQEKSVTVIAPDHEAAPATPGEYTDDHEPMMFLAPARIRKVVTSLGGEVFTVPDVAAFKDVISMLDLSELSSGSVFVYFGSDIIEANALGACGVLDCATLPIFNSAWKSYEAINKIGDEIAYNAKQMQTFANGAAGTASNAIVGGAIGGVLGGAANIITGIVGTGSAMYGNAEELRAKQVTIKNSPCNVKSTGSGLTAAVEGLVSMDYVTLKMDEQSTEKLRQMYYWFGYHVNRTFRGTISLYTRELFDFIKTNGAKVDGRIMSEARKQIADIFDRGVTIYHTTSGYTSIGDSTMLQNDEV